MGKPVRQLSQQEVIWQADGANWSLYITWAEVAGRAEPVGLSLASYWQPPAGDRLAPLGQNLRPVTTAVLRAGLLAVVETARRDAARGASSLVQALEFLGDQDEDVEADLAAARQALTVRTSGRARKLVDAAGVALAPSDALAEVAAIYMAAWQARENPTQAVAERVGLSRSAAAKRVARARAAGLLPPTSKGRAGGRAVD